MTRWSTTTKRWILTGIIIAAVWAIYRFSSILPPFIMAVLLAYIMNPLVAGLTRFVRLPRVASALLVYGGFLLLVFLVPLLFIPVAVRQVQDLDINFTQVAQDMVAYLQPTLDHFSRIQLFGETIYLPLDFDQLRAALENNLNAIGSRGANLLFGFTSTFASGLFLLVLILFVSFYLVKDSQAIGDYLIGLMPADYRDEALQIGREIEDVWNSFLRGQLILCGVIGLVTYVALLFLGMPNALLLAVLAGLLEIVPTLGPILAMVPAVVVALLQGSGSLPVDHLTFAGIVVLTYFVIQQLENNLLVPRIIGSSVNLHPVVIILGVVAGASLSGVLGIFLAAPALATLRIIGRHIYRHLVEEPAPKEAGRELVKPPAVLMPGQGAIGTSAVVPHIPVPGRESASEPGISTLVAADSGATQPDVVTES